MVTSSSTPTALKHNHAVEVFLGDDVEPFGFRIRDTGASGAMSADDYTLTSQLRAKATDTDALETWTLTVTDSTDDDEVDPDTLRVVFSMTASEVEALGVKALVWDLQVDGPTGKWTPIAGTLKVIQDVTRP